MTQMKAVLAYQIPAQCYVAESPLYSMLALPLPIYNATNTWPADDGATAPGWHWTVGYHDNMLCYRLDKPYNVDNRLLVYSRSSKSLFKQSVMSQLPQFYGAACGNSSVSGQRFAIDLSHTPLAGIYPQNPDNGVYYLGPLTTDNPMMINYLELGHPDTTNGVDIWENSLWQSIDLPYNPELTTYSVTPIMPASQTFTSLAGKKMKQVYGDTLYKISMTYTWSDEEATKRLEEGLKITLTKGTSLLFAPPVDNFDRATRPVYLLQLEDAPVITQPQRGVWTVTINGETQP